ncbi:MAG: permease [Vicingaceae bacterium]
MGFLETYAQAVTTSLGYFWMALWAFVLGYLISGMIQIFVSRERMQQSMGASEGKGVLLGTFFGFISSSCSFSALASAKSIFSKGASFIASLAFLLASTNLVIELGLLIFIFLDWQFVTAEYIGGILLILFSWLLYRLKKPKSLIKSARDRLSEEEGHHHDSEIPSLWSIKAWQQVAQKYFMEWGMVWKDVTIGFTVAGIIAAFVPQSFFEALFINTGGGNSEYSFVELLQHAAIGPVAAFCTFIGSMGNIPLAAVLYQNGVSFAGVMAFIFSDLVVFPVLRINARYYGWKMSFYILILLFISLVFTSISLHYGFDFFGALPEAATEAAQKQEYFKLDYTFYLNLFFLLLSLLLAYLKFFKGAEHQHDHAMAKKGNFDRLLKALAILSYLWLGGGLVVKYLIL